MPTRHEKIKQQEARREGERRRKNFIIGTGIVVGVLLVVGIGLALANTTLAAPAPTAVTVASQGQCAAVQDFPSQGATHIAPGEAHPPYSSNPPTSGWHWANPQEWGIYTTPQVQEQLVHNLEHGGIIIQYNNLPAADVERLTTLVQHDRIHMILAPYPDLPSGSNVAITAWTHLLLCNGVSEDAIKRFTTAFRDKGPELVP
ncbi:MAG: DUF3105 domain-containing protein [Chloroflexi bacterium]|nr:DUF3105 domain-containing protein [Chloroflexota bacterium]